VVDVSNGQLHPGSTVVIDGKRIVSVVSHGPTPASGTVRDQPTTHLLFGSSEIRETSRYVPTKATVGLTRRRTS